MIKFAQFDLPQELTTPITARLDDRETRCAPPAKEKRPAVLERSGTKQTISFKDRLASFAKETRKKASLLSAGIEKDDLLRKACQAEATFDWANSPGLQPAK